ncbi:hypothetical protein TSUD_44370 [Trifolium subterraneum]|uniref:tripeptidyl-peptidase II n=2 Tax=Trifolium TaxID=3898 RepID=A0A2Z6MIG8_TRISU|nr:hypothetical protein TSUD_44370 [Trifolium subterraneum]
MRLRTLPSPFLINHHRHTKPNLFPRPNCPLSIPKPMLCSSFTSSHSGGGGVDDDGGNNNNNTNGTASSRNFKQLNQSTFLASLMPKTEIGVDRFLHSYPHYDGRGVLIAIFGEDRLKCRKMLANTGSGDIDTSKVVKADADGCISGASGASLAINTSWKNPSGEWHVGYKLVYELFTETLTSRLKKERKKKWDEINQEEIAKTLKQLNDFDLQHRKVDDAKLKKAREDLQNRIDFLKKQSEGYNDKGPAIDAVVWNDGEVWRVALDTQSLEDDSDCGKLANFVPLTNYRTERKYGVFSKLDACTFVVNVYNDGNVLSLVTDCSPHGTHVAGIATAFHPEEPLLNGVAPGAQLISCKIGDARLGSLETGTGLTRALIAAVEHKCDLINMSYGEPTLLPDYGRFVDLVNEVVNKHRLIFVSSAGNSGPALSTVGAPGGTSSSIIGVGAYVSPAMAAGAHSVVEPPSEGLEYTWSSRGPTTDGDLGVSISAPGGAIAPVPTWTLQRRMLMNGTSMSSPSACGGIALLLSAMKAEGIPVSPYSVRKALENTTVPIGDSPEDKLSTGQGLMQVDKCYEYLQQSQNIPCVWYQINIKQSGKTNPSSRGIYLREANACRQSTEWTVQVDPKFHEDADKFEDLVVFEECIELHSSDNTVVKAPDILVDPSNLCDGLHYYEVYGIDCKAPWRGPLFRIPITITKPVAVINRTPQVSFSEMLFQPGHIERKYIEVPHGASWVEATMNISSFDTPRRFFVDTVQICPLQSPLKWRSVVTFSSPAAKNFTFRVVGGQTLELVIAQFWSSGIGSHETTNVDLKIVFHGIKASQEEIVLDGSEAPVRVDAEALLASEKLTPVANLKKIRVPYRPVDAKISALSNDRDRLPSGKQMLALTLTYKVKLDDGAEIKPRIPFLNGRIYDTKFESQFYMISDSNKRIYSSGDAYPTSTKLPKGEYNLQLYVRHENLQILEKMKHLVLFIERTLEEKDIIRLSFFSRPDGPLIGNGSFKSSTLIPGIKEGFYLGPPAKDKLPKIDEDKGKNSSPSSKKTVSERLEEEVRDTKIKVLGGIKQESDEDLLEWNKLAALLKIINAANEVVDSIDREELAKILALKIDQDDEEAEKTKKKMESTRDQLAEALYQKGLALAEIESLKVEFLDLTLINEVGNSQASAATEGAEPDEQSKDDGINPDLFDENFKELKKWVDVKCTKYGILLVKHERRSQRVGTALKVLTDIIQNDTEPAKEKLYELKISLLEEVGWTHLATYERQWMIVRFPPSLPLF